MSGPIPFASAPFPNGPGQSIDCLTAMPNGVAYGLGQLGLFGTQYYDDNFAPLSIKSGATGVSLSGTVSFYLVASEDGTHWTNGINPNVKTDQSTLLIGLEPLSPVLSVTQNGTVYVMPEFSIVSVMLFMPTYWSIVVYNESGAAFDATAANFYAQHVLFSYP